VTEVLSVEHLQKKYGDFAAVADVSFRVEEGEVFGVLGPNGAGKTTTVECVQACAPSTAARCRCSVLTRARILES
jgi:ABC-2 type transport system ATP-binding protein